MDFYLIFLAIVLIFFMMVLITKWGPVPNPNQNKNEKPLNTEIFKEYFPDDHVEPLSSGNYLSGHPLLDAPFASSTLKLKSDHVAISVGFLEKATIPKKLITNITMEDASKIEKRIGLTRLLFTGVIALAWRKSEKIENTYLIIEWSQNGFKNETIFEMSGNGSIQKANTLRNKFLKYLTSN